MTAADWPAVQAIYAAGIATGDATFETEPPSWEQSRPHPVARPAQRVGTHHGRWRDVVFVERRSDAVGA
jgi:L-amino acid N-acyltransferase YncA